MHALIKQLVESGRVDPKKIEKLEKELERAKLIAKGMEACRENIKFSFKTSKQECYESNGRIAPSLEVWAICTRDGIFSCYSNTTGNNLIGECDLTSFESIFDAMDNVDMNKILRDFFEEQINKSS